MKSPIDLSKVTTYPLAQRKNKVKIADFAKSPAPDRTFDDFLSSLPNILAAKELRELVEHIVLAYTKGKPVVVMMGAHVIKCGLSPVIISLMERGVISAA